MDAGAHTPSEEISNNHNLLCRTQYRHTYRHKIVHEVCVWFACIGKCVSQLG